MRDKTRTTVGAYLVRRLEQAGLKHIFGVPGDYVLGLYKLLETSRMRLVCNCNELNAATPPTPTPVSTASAPSA